MRSCLRIWSNDIYHLTGILQVMQYAPSTWMRTRTALINLSGLKVLVFRPRPLWKFGKGGRGKKAAFIVLCRKSYTSKQKTRLPARCGMNVSLPVNPPRLTTVRVKLVWECMFLDIIRLKVIYEKSNVTEQNQQMKWFVLSCYLPLSSGAYVLWLLQAIGIGK